MAHHTMKVRSTAGLPQEEEQCDVTDVWQVHMLMCSGLSLPTPLVQDH